MNGKLVKVKQYNLEFGVKDRYVNILGCFKYLKNGNIYIIYTDIDTKYNLIYYGSGHLKENVALCMNCRENIEVEIIKEYIYKIINKDSNMNDYEYLSLENIESIEIIASNKIEVKHEVLTTLIEYLIPVSKEEEKIITENNKKEKKKKNILIPVLIIIVALTLFYFYITLINKKDTLTKHITCTKNYEHTSLTANTNETNIYSFNNNDELKTIKSTTIYQFNETSYQEFIFKGTYHKYIPDKEIGNWDKDDNNYIFKVTTNEYVNNSYNKPTKYEEVLTYYKKNGYTCQESLKDEE